MLLGEASAVAMQAERTSKAVDRMTAVLKVESLFGLFSRIFGLLDGVADKR